MNHHPGRTAAPADPDTLDKPLGPDETGPHASGTAGVQRSLHEFPGRGTTVSFAVGGVVVQDDDDLSVFASVPGSGKASRAGRAAGPNSRIVPWDTWDGSYNIGAWRGTTVVRVHRRGEPWSIWRWHDGTAWTDDWYGNLEAPWSRTTLGFDSRDYALDVTGHGTPGTSSWEVAFKDEDELAWFVESRTITQAVADRITAIGHELLEVFHDAAGVIGADWDAWLPRPEWEPTPLPDGWEQVR